MFLLAKKTLSKGQRQIVHHLIHFSETDEAEFNMILTPEMVKAEFPQIEGALSEDEEQSIKLER